MDQPKPAMIAPEYFNHDGTSQVQFYEQTLTDPTFSCLCPGDPVDLLAQLGDPNATPLMPPNFGRYVRNTTVPQLFILNTSFCGVSTSIGISAPTHWHFGEQARAPSVPFAPELEADPGLWLVKIHMDWQLYHDQGDWPDFAAPLDMLAALMQSDAAIFMEDQSEHVHLFRPGFLKDRFDMRPDAEILIPVSAEGETVFSDEELYMSHPGISGVQTVKTLEPFRAISKPERGWPEHMTPAQLADLDTRLRAALPWAESAI